jgi:hypothetical protein
VKLFFPSFPQTLEIDVADFHITTATTTTGISTNDKERRKTSSNNYRELWLSLSGKIG